MEVHLAKSRRWYYKIISSQNGQTLLTSQTYFSKFNARRAAKRFADHNQLNYMEE